MPAQDHGEYTRLHSDHSARVITTARSSLTSYDLVIVGAGHAGVAAAAESVRSRFNGTVALVSAEHGLPYERPPLSKTFLTEVESVPTPLVGGEDYWSASQVELVVGCRVVRIMPSEHLLQTSGGQTIRYGRLLWAAGGRARPLSIPGVELHGVLSLRSLNDAINLRSISPGRRLVVLGGGYVGLEVAAAMSTNRVDVQIVEAEQELLSRVTSENIARYVMRKHQESGVRIVLGHRATQILGEGGRVAGVELDSGERLAADFVLVAVGLQPEVGVLLDAGAEGADGIHIDEYGRTSLPDVWAAGDCAAMPAPDRAGGRLRLESIQSAAEQARAVVRTMTGDFTPMAYVPWFWSHQYGSVLRTVGLVSGYDRLVVRGDADSDSFSVFYLREGTLIAADCVNSTRDYVAARTGINKPWRVSE